MNLKHQFHPRRLGSSVQEESVVRFRSDILLKRELCCEDENKSQNAKRHFFFCIFFIWSCFVFFPPAAPLSLIALMQTAI